MPIPKTSGANRKRINALQLVLKLIREAPGGLSVAQLNAAMNISESTGKGYLRALLEGGCVTRKVCKEDRAHPRSIYKVCGTQAHIYKFMESLRYCPTLPPKMTQEQRMAHDPARHFHVADDDEPVKVRVSRPRCPPRDELVAAIFGPAQAAA